MCEADMLDCILPIYTETGFGVVLEHLLSNLLWFGVDRTLFVVVGDLDVIELVQER